MEAPTSLLVRIGNDVAMCFLLGSFALAQMPGNEAVQVIVIVLLGLLAADAAALLWILARRLTRQDPEPVVDTTELSWPQVKDEGAVVTSSVVIVTPRKPQVGVFVDGGRKASPCKKNWSYGSNQNVSGE